MRKEKIAKCVNIPVKCEGKIIGRVTDIEVVDDNLMATATLSSKNVVAYVPDLNPSSRNFGGNKKETLVVKWKIEVS